MPFTVRKPTAAEQRSTSRREKSLLRNERALSEVLGVLMIMSVLLSVCSIYIAREVPEWTKEFESLHIAGVTDEFAELDSLADGVVLVAKQQRTNTTASGTQPIKMKPDKVPFFGLSPPGSILSFQPYAEEVFMILPYVGPPPNATGPIYNYTIEESTTADFSYTNATTKNNATRVHVDVSFDQITLERMGISGDLILDNEITTLSGDLQYDTVSITNSSIVYLVPGNYLKLYANTIYIDDTSKIIADGCGFEGGDGGENGNGIGFGRFGYNGSGGGGASHAGTGGDGGRGAISGDPLNDTGKGGTAIYGVNTTFEFGSGGGGGGYGTGGQGAPHQGQIGGDGGNGGGIVVLDASVVRIAGTISADGNDGAQGLDAKEASGGGGGGSAGTIVIRGCEVNLSSATLSAQGGDGGDGGKRTTGSGASGGGGGGGAGGRIKIFYDNASLYAVPSSLPVNGGTGGIKGGVNAEDGVSGNPGVFYENQTTYISTVPHYSSGYYVSRVYDTGNTTTCYGNITWSATTDEYTPLTIKVRTSRSPVMEGNASLWGNCPAVSNGQDISELSSAFDGHRYIQFRADLYTYDSATTPVLDWIRLNYASRCGGGAGGTPVVDSATGAIAFHSAYLYYPNQELVYEHGAVIKAQGRGSDRKGFVVHSPAITIKPDTVTGKPSVEVSMINLIGTNFTYAGATTTSVELQYDDYDHTAGTIVFDNLSLHFVTEYPHIWSRWFNMTLEASGLDVTDDYQVLVNESEPSVRVEFYGGAPGVKLYEDKTTIRAALTQ